MALIGVGLVVFNGSFILQLSPAGDILTPDSCINVGFLLLASQENEYSLSDIVHYTESFLLWFGDSLPLFLVYPLQTDIHILFRPVVALNLLFLG